MHKYGILLVCFSLFFFDLAGQGKEKEKEKEKEIKLVETTGEFQIGLVLPFCAKEVLENPKSKNAAVSQAAREYYQGFLLAFDSLNLKHPGLKLLVYDTKLDSAQFKKILEKKDFQNCDLIFGPIMKQGMDMMQEFSLKNKVYHVSPLLTLTKSSIDDPYLISAYPDLKYYPKFILNNIKASGERNVNLVILAGKENNSKIIADEFIALKANYKDISIKVLDIAKYNEYTKLHKLSAANHVVLASENEYLVNSSLRLISDSSQFLGIKTWGFKKMFEFNSLLLPLWEQTRLTIVTPYYPNYQNPELKLMIEKYRERFYTEPNEFAINGYEQALVYISALINHHGELNKITEGPSICIHGNCYKIQTKDGLKSMQNTGLKRVYIDNLNVQVE